MLRSLTGEVESAGSVIAKKFGLCLPIAIRNCLKYQLSAQFSPSYEIQATTTHAYKLCLGRVAITFVIFPLTQSSLISCAYIFVVELIVMANFANNNSRY